MGLFARETFRDIVRFSDPPITPSIDYQSWEEECEPGRLWVVVTHREETLIDFWIAYITRGPKLLPPARHAPEVRLLRASPSAQATEALSGLVGPSITRQGGGSEPPNEKARKLAHRILEASFSTDILRPRVSVSAEGGVALVYRGAGRYVAIETLNRGSAWMMWFDSNGEPQSRRITAGGKAIGLAIEEVARIINNA